MAFNQKIKNIPESIKELDFGFGWNQSLEYLPDHIEIISLGMSYNLEIKKYPKKLKIIKTFNEIKINDENVIIEMKKYKNNDCEDIEETDNEKVNIFEIFGKYKHTNTNLKRQAHSAFIKMLTKSNKN